MKNLNSGSATIGIIIAVVVILIVGYLFVNNSGDTPAEVTTTEINVAVEQETNVIEVTEDETSLETPDEVVENTEIVPDVTQELPTPAPAPLAAGIYTDYNESLLVNAEDGPVLIFFHATWCPTCRTLDKSINANLDDIPDGVTILRADYDTEKVLKKKYGVVRQHTLVQVDSNGNQIKTLTGLTNSLSQVVKQI